MNDSPGLFLFGLDSTSWSSVSGFYFITFSFVTKFSFSLTKYLLKSEEFCLFEPCEDGQDISCRSMMFGASRSMGGTFCFSSKTEYLEDGVVRFLTSSFSHSASQDWPTIGTRIYQRITNACVVFTPRFCLLL
jgi:hypothetical protein